jgi:hypothetical protein
VSDFSKKNRLHKLLDDAGIKLGGGADIDRVYARKMVEGLIAGRTPEQLSAGDSFNPTSAGLAKFATGYLSRRWLSVWWRFHRSTLLLDFFKNPPVSRKSGKTRHGNPIARYLLCEAANAARRTRTLFRAKYESMVIRRGYKKTIIAVAHKLIRTIYIVLGRRARSSWGDVRYSLTRRQTKRADMLCPLP